MRNNLSGISQDDTQLLLLLLQLGIEFVQTFQDEIGPKDSGPTMCGLCKGGFRINHDQGQDGVGRLTGGQQRGIVVQTQSIAKPMNGQVIVLLRRCRCRRRCIGGAPHGLPHGGSPCRGGCKGRRSTREEREATHNGCCSRRKEWLPHFDRFFFFFFLRWRNVPCYKGFVSLVTRRGCFSLNVTNHLDHFGDCHVLLVGRCEMRCLILSLSWCRRVRGDLPNEERSVCATDPLTHNDRPALYRTSTASRSRVFWIRNHFSTAHAIV